MQHHKFGKGMYLVPLCIISTLTAAGCSSDQANLTPSSAESAQSSPVAEPSAPPTLSNGAYVSTDENGGRYWVMPEYSEEQRKQDLIESNDLGGVTVPDVNFISFDGSDIPNWRQCMADQGFPGSWEPEGQTWSSGLISPAQSEPYRIAEYVCAVQYPPEINPPYNEEEIKRLYDWQVNTTMPCFTKYGIELPDPPSQEQYVDEWFTSMSLSWWPERYVDDYEFSSARGPCPILPPDFY